LRTLTRAQLAAELAHAGLAKGDIVFIQSRLYTLGRVEDAADRSAYLRFFADGIFDVIGESGTLAVLTAFEDYGRYGTPFVLETSPSRSGMFSEFVRTLPGAVRSRHPLFSITAVGARADQLCGGEQPDAFGAGSSWDRLRTMGAKILLLGVDFKESFTFGHYIEQSFGVPYAYMKLFTAECWAGGRQLAGPFTANVRYLDYGVVYDFSRFEQHLLDRQKVVRGRLGVGQFLLMSAPDVFAEGIECLRRDRYYLLQAPPVFQPGKPPLDGPTGAMLTNDQILARASGR
jgi:aminoglycoside 3-N-acetyltransferase